MADPIRTEGLRQLRRDLRAVQPDVLPEIRDVLKGAAQDVARDASRLAPKKSGRLAASLKGTTAGDKGVVRAARVPYGPVHEYGGTINPTGRHEIKIKRRQFVGRALSGMQSRLVTRLGDGIEKVARRHGWR